MSANRLGQGLTYNNNHHLLLTKRRKIHGNSDVCLCLCVCMYEKV